jgi:hypothetical protein
MNDVSFLSDINWNQGLVSSAPDDVEDNGSPDSVFFDRIMNDDPSLDGLEFISDNGMWRTQEASVGHSVGLKENKKIDEVGKDLAIDLPYGTLLMHNRRAFVSSR